MITVFALKGWIGVEVSEEVRVISFHDNTSGDDEGPENRHWVGVDSLSYGHVLLITGDCLRSNAEVTAMAPFLLPPGSVEVAVGLDVRDICDLFLRHRQSACLNKSQDFMNAAV